MAEDWWAEATLACAEAQRDLLTALFSTPHFTVECAGRGGGVERAVVGFEVIWVV